VNAAIAKKKEPAEPNFAVDQPLEHPAASCVSPEINGKYGE
jgi:hypothetical protein